MASTVKKKSKKSNGFILAGIAFVAVIIGVVVFSFVSSLLQKETYYILNQDVPARTQVTPEMLDPIAATQGTAPQAAVGLGDVQTGNVYTKFPLLAGDILTMSNVGSLEDISVGIPDEWVVTNFSVDADDAVGGRVQRGSYFDMLVTTENGSFYPFVNVLALDTTVDLSNASSADAADTAEAHSGQTTQYVVGMSPENAGKLHDIVRTYTGDIKLVLSPRQNEYERPQLASYDGMFKFEGEVIWPGESDAGERTDYTFTDVDRDEFGKPTEQIENCSAGNAKVTGEDCEI